MEIQTHSPEETIDFGRKIGSRLSGGEVIALIGNLGTGKTHLIKGIVSGLGAGDPTRVSSPTFVLINEYDDPERGITVYHLDAYRLESAVELDNLGFDDYCRPDAVLLVEWADKILPVLQDIPHQTIYLEHASDNRRRLVLENFAADVEKFLHNLS